MKKHLPFSIFNLSVKEFVSIGFSSMTNGKLKIENGKCFF